MRVKSLPKILRATGLVVGVNYAAWATGQTYTIQQISLTGSTYTVGGTPSSSFAAAQTLTTGQVAGTTNRFPSGGGKDAWFYDPDTNTALEVGLYGPGYQSTVDAAQVSNIIADNSADDVIGYSNPYSGSTELGETSWEYFGSTGTTQIIGLYGAGYTQSGDYSYVIDQAMDSTGDAVGTSKRYDGTNLQVGTDAWYYSASTNSSQVIGFTGAGYNFTTADGATSETSAVKAMSSSGAAVGTSDRYSGSTSEGQDAWYYDPSGGTTTQIGLTGPTYQGAGGLANSSVTAMSPSGMTVGTTTRYFGGSSGMGADAWLYNPTNNSNTQIGLTTANYQNGNVEQSSISAVNSLGQAAGTSFRYLSGTQIGQDAWFYNPTSNTTTAIGLTGSVYVSPTNSTRNSSISSLNTNGLVTGTSNRYDGSGNSLGSDAWLYNAATNTTMQIGLTGAGYVSSTGAETSFPSVLSNTGLVGGFSNRYNGATQEGQDGWVFDNNTDTTYTLDFSQNAAGSASTTISYISDSGIVVGSYIKYTGASSTTDAFEWTESGGFIDLNTAVPNLSAWSLLGQATRVSNSGQIVGYGTPAGETGTTAAVWVLTPIYQPASLTWTNASSDGLWNTASSANWNNGTGTTVFNATDNVTFNDANGGAGNYAVALNTTVSPGSVTVNNSSGNYAITGAGMIADAGSLTKLGSGTLTLGVATSASSVSINSGTVAIAPNVTLGSGAATSNVNFGSLAITGTSALDVNNNHIIITYGATDPIATIAAYIASGYNSGAWNGPGIISTTAQTPTNGLNYGVGYADGADGVVAGLASGQIEIKYTLYGDANLDGVVNGTDFGIMAANFGQQVNGWDKGDFNYDGVVNGSDFGALAANFGQQDNGAAVELPTTDWTALDAFAAANGLLADVPEPTSLGFLALGVIGALARRRRR